MRRSNIDAAMKTLTREVSSFTISVHYDHHRTYLNSMILTCSLS